MARSSRPQRDGSADLRLCSVTPSSSPPSSSPPRRAVLQRAATWIFRGLVLAYFVAALGILGVRYILLPQANAYRSEIALAIGEALGLPVDIGAIDTSWNGLRPRLKLARLVVRDQAGRDALMLSRVDATLSWTSLARLEPHFSLLEFFGPRLEIRREADGRIIVAGLPVDTDASGGSGFAEWLLAQDEIAIHDAELSWTDELRGAAALELDPGVPGEALGQGL